MNHQIQSKEVEAELVLPVGHIAPVRFRLDDDMIVQPYSLPPWDPESCNMDAPALKWLRGEFFGFPFGANDAAEYPHGPAANGPWELTESTSSEVKLMLDLPRLGGTIEKQVTLRERHRVLYHQHTVSGVEGYYNYGHHPVLEIPKGSVVQIRSSAFKYGSVYPRTAAPDPTEINILKQGECFDCLAEVPLANGGTLSFADYPSRIQHEDLIMISAADEVVLGWTAVSFENYVWLTIRSTKQFPSTLFWLTNGGRTAAPWNGTHKRRIGVEDVCSYFGDGFDVSRTEPLAKHGISCTRLFTAEQSTVLRNAQMVVPTNGQQAVQSVTEIEGEQQVRIQFENGYETCAALDWEWLLEDKG